MHSTLTALLETTNNWSINIDNGLVFFDLKKAFDTIDQEIILRKLATIGLIKVLYDFLCPAYVTDPKNAVSMELYPLQVSSPGKYTGTSALFNIYKVSS